LKNSNIWIKAKDCILLAGYINNLEITKKHCNIIKNVYRLTKEKRKKEQFILKLTMQVLLTILDLCIIVWIKTPRPSNIMKDAYKLRKKRREKDQLPLWVLLIIWVWRISVRQTIKKHYNILKDVYR